MNKLKTAHKGHLRALGFAAIPLLVIAAGCASTPVPEAKLALAQSSIERAEQAEAVTLAGAPLRNAREKLEGAKLAAAKKDGAQAGRLAEQADADAQLAEAMARAARSEKAVTDLEQSLRALSNEAQRNSTPSSTTSGGAR